MQRTIFFSVVTACKNGLPFFKEAFESILNQTFLDWEWIIVDDSSSEPIGTFIETKKDPRVVFLRNSESQGQTKCLNLGIQKSKSNWIVRMDADDLAYPQRLEIICNTIEKTGKNFSTLLFSDYDVMDENGVKFSSVQYKQPLGSRFYNYLNVTNNPICHPTVAFPKYDPKKNIYQYNESLQNAQDYALWKRIYLDYLNLGFIHIPTPLICYRIVRSSLSGVRILEQEMELKKIQGIYKNTLDTVSLNPDEQEGMYAYRMLYYSFIGNKVKFKNIFKTFLKTKKYLPVFLKSLLLTLGFPIKEILKTKLFCGIYK